MKNWILLTQLNPPADTPILVYCPTAKEGFEHAIIKVDKAGRIYQYEKEEDKFVLYQPAGFSNWPITHWRRLDFPEVTWEYSLSSNVIWCSLDHGTVLASTEREAFERAARALTNNFERANKQIKGLNLNFDCSEIVVTRKP